MSWATAKNVGAAGPGVSAQAPEVGLNAQEVAGSKAFPYKCSSLPCRRPSVWVMETSREPLTFLAFFWPGIGQRGARA